MHDPEPDWSKLQEPDTDFHPDQCGFENTLKHISAAQWPELKTPAPLAAFPGTVTETLAYLSSETMARISCSSVAARLASPSLDRAVNNTSASRGLAINLQCRVSFSSCRIELVQTASLIQAQSTQGDCKKHILKASVADPDPRSRFGIQDPRSGAFLTPGSGIRDGAKYRSRIREPGCAMNILVIICENLVSVFWV